MKALLTVTVLLLGACATTPQDTVTTEPYRLSGKLPPEQYARCLITNAENVSGDFSGREDQPVQPSWKKVMIRHSTGGASVIADIAPKGSGSDVTLWLSRNHFMRDTLVELMTKGC